MIARLHACVVGVVELRRCGAMNGQWQVRVIRNVGKGGDRRWWPGRYQRAFDALRDVARYEGLAMSAFYSDPPQVTA